MLKVFTFWWISFSYRDRENLLGFHFFCFCHETEICHGDFQIPHHPLSARFRAYLFRHLKHHCTNCLDKATVLSSVHCVISVKCQRKCLIRLQTWLSLQSEVESFPLPPLKMNKRLDPEPVVASGAPAA